MKLTLPLLFMKSAKISVKQRASMLLTQRLSSFQNPNQTNTSLSRSSDQAKHEPFDKLRANGENGRSVVWVQRYKSKGTKQRNSTNSIANNDHMTLTYGQKS